MQVLGMYTPTRMLVPKERGNHLPDACERARAAAPAAKPRQPAAAPTRRKAARSKARQGTSPPPPPKPKRQPLVHEPRKPKAAKAKAGDFDLFGDDMLLDPYSF